MPSCFGGPSDAQKGLARSGAGFSSQLQGDFASRFAGQNDIIGKLGSILQDVRNGKLLPGFSAQTLAALNTSAIDTTAGNYRNAAQAVNNANAGRGGNSGLESGIEQQEQTTAANAAAGQLSTEQQKIQLANQANAEQNTQTVLSGYNALAGQENPLGFAGASLEGNKQAFGEASTVNQLENQQLANELNFGVSTAMDAATLGAGGIGNLDTMGGSSFGEQVGNFASGGFNALAG